MMNELILYKRCIGDITSYDPKAVGEVIDHYNGEGVYVRSMKLPQQRFILSNVHKYSCISFMMQGELIMFGDDKSEKRIKGPHIFESKAGIRRAAYTIT